jgi:3-oxoacyl-[acyl-carrier protein] reductase
MATEQAGHNARPVVIVTGASRQRGIGAAICMELARTGMDILFTHWTPYDATMEWGAEEGTRLMLYGRAWQR